MRDSASGNPVVAAASAPGAQAAAAASRSAGKAAWGTLPDGTEIGLITLRNGNGVEATLSEFGGTLVTLRTPDRDGVFADIVLGHDEVRSYSGQETASYFGATIGRYGNRIAEGKFSIGGKAFTLAANNGPNHLHGGRQGFDQRVWKGASFEAAGGVGAEFTYRSKDGEEGYPGNLDVTVRYTLTDRDELRIDYEATTDAPTHVNLTNHSYWNLSGDAARDILGHILMIDADCMTPVDAGLIPTGEIAPVEETPFDFRKPTAIGERIDRDDAQLKHGKGYDHNWVLAGTGKAMKVAAVLADPQSGRALEISTTEPGLQFYSGNFLDGKTVGKGGRPYGFRSGLCLETQHYPDTPNQKTFPTTLLKPGETYKTTTVHRFFVQAR